MTGLEMIKANAELALAQFRKANPDFSYDAETIAYVDTFIEGQRQREWSEEGLSRLISVVGSFLGECIIACYGGHWEYEPQFETWAVVLHDKFKAYPFTKTRKHFENGDGDNIKGFFDMLAASKQMQDMIFKSDAAEPGPPGRRPRWWPFGKN